MSVYSCTFVSVTPKGKYIISTITCRDFFDLINEVWVFKEGKMWIRGEHRTEKYKNVFTSSSLEEEDSYFEIEVSKDNKCFEDQHIPYIFLKNMIFS